MTRIPFAFLFAACFSLSAQAQITPTPFFVPGGVAGVYIDANGTLRQRQTDSTTDLAAQRLRAKSLNQPPKAQDLTYISLPRVFAELKSLVEQKKELPDDLRYLSGITQIRYIFLYPEEHDLVLAGVSEPFEASNKAQPTGKVTGRPVLHLDDLIVALRLGAAGNHRPFGCSIDPQADAMTRTSAAMKDNANSTRGARMKAMKEAIGPQEVRMFGAPNDSRLTFITVAADYKLKRLCLGVDPMPVPGIGSPVDNTRAAGNRFWFELNYEPLLVSPDNDAFELRGQRLMLKAGAFSFDPKGATETAKTFAKNFTAKIPQLATVVPLFAELQNIADLSVVASLLSSDQLDKKTGIDLSWILTESNYKTQIVPTPRTAEALVNFSNGSIVAGGVTFDVRSVLGPSSREFDKSHTLKGAKSRPPSNTWYETRAAADTRKELSHR